MLFICYPRCTTCRKAREYLDSRGIKYDFRDIKLDKPTEDELRKWYKLSALPLRRFFNTSGQQYRSLGLKDKIPAMSEDEQLALLATDGLLVKRPILVGDDFVLLGFNQEEWDERLK
jgi:arsenate reductase